MIFKVLAKLSGAQFHESSALDVRQRILAFFDEHLTVGRHGSRVTGPL